MNNTGKQNNADTLTKELERKNDFGAKKSSKDCAVLPDDLKNEKNGIIKNVVVICISFLFLFTGYNSMSLLQSSINPDIGTNALSALYAGMVVSCLFLPSIIIQKLKLRLTLAISMLTYSLYIAAQYYPENYTLIPTAVILGMGAANLWSAKCTYLTQVARRYAAITNKNEEVIVTRFFGIFFLFFQSTLIWGNVISSAILSVNAELVDINDTARLSQCGIHFCPGDTNNTVNLEDDVSDFQRYLMSTIYLAFALASSVIILVFLDPLTRFRGIKTLAASSNRGHFDLLTATLAHCKKPTQLLLIPLTMWSGIEQAFFNADYTASYISCGLGVHMVGYVIICYGISDALSSVSFSPVVQKVGRIPVFTFGALLNVALIVALILWQPMPDALWPFFVFAAVWGVADAIWQTQINAFYGVLFPYESEAAFSNYRLWESCGFIIAYACSSAICTKAKIIILVFFLCTGMFGYYIIEFLRWRGVLKDSTTNISQSTLTT